MNKFLTYKDMKIEVVRQTGVPNSVIYRACNLTQTNNEGFSIPEEKDIAKLIKYLVTANHTSVFEHASITLQLSNVSRSFLAQITRHRMASYTSSSQHYQEYDEYPNVLHADMVNKDGVLILLDMVDKVYKELIEKGIPKEEARQILPNAKAVNILWTINARSLMNFLNLRLCKRNVLEMRNAAELIHVYACAWWDDLFKLVGPDCFMHGKCTQGYMKAEECKKGGRY